MDMAICIEFSYRINAIFVGHADVDDQQVGLVFGYFGYLLSMGIFERKLGSILLSLVIGILYGGLAFGMIPFLVPGFISWQMHLFGFLGGVFAAWTINRRTRSGKRRLLEGGI